MVVTEPKIEVRTRGPLAPFMEARGITVRDLAFKVSDRKRTWSHGTIGNLRSARRPVNVNNDLAKRIAKALDFPFDVMFVERVSTVSREVGPCGQRENNGRGRAA